MVGSRSGEDGRYLGGRAIDAGLALVGFLGTCLLVAVPGMIGELGGVGLVFPAAFLLLALRLLRFA